MNVFSEQTFAVTLEKYKILSRNPNILIGNNKNGERFMFVEHVQDTPATICLIFKPFTRSVIMYVQLQSQWMLPILAIFTDWIILYKEYDKFAYSIAALKHTCMRNYYFRLLISFNRSIRQNNNTGAFHFVFLKSYHFPVWDSKQYNK